MGAASRLATALLQGVAVLAVGVAACGASDDGSDERPYAVAAGHSSPGESWTVMVYVVGGNGLEALALIDLVEMATVGSGPGFDLVVQIDRSEGHSDASLMSLADFTTTKRLHVLPGALRELSDEGELDMGDPATLADFIAWSAARFPADQYALILWDHGLGWTGFGGDDAFKTGPGGGVLTLAELADGLSAGLARAGRERFGLIGFDACLMATWEVAHALAPYGEYLLASEELIPGHGWAYDGLAAVRADPGLPPERLGRTLMARYAKRSREVGSDGRLSQSLVDLTRAPEVDAAVAGLALSLGGATGREAAAIARARDLTLRFADSPDPARATNLVDLGDLAARLRDEGLPVGAALDAVGAALDAAVVDQVRGPATERASGLSIYFPPAVAYYDSRYTTLRGAGPWREFLARYFAVEPVEPGPVIVGKGDEDEKGRAAPVEVELFQAGRRIAAQGVVRDVGSAQVLVVPLAASGGESPWVTFEQVWVGSHAYPGGLWAWTDYGVGPVPLDGRVRLAPRELIRDAAGAPLAWRAGGPMALDAAQPLLARRGPERLP